MASACSMVAAFCEGGGTVASARIASDSGGVESCQLMSVIELSQSWWSAAAATAADGPFSGLSGPGREVGSAASTPVRETPRVSRTRHVSGQVHKPSAVCLRFAGEKGALTESVHRGAQLP